MGPIIDLVKCSQIFTMDQGRPSANAMAIYNGKIIAIGSDSEVRARILQHEVDMGFETPAIINENNYPNNYILPGFIDAHLHSIQAITRRRLLDCSGFRSMKELKLGLSELIQSKKYEQWAIGVRFNEQNFSDEGERRLPTNLELDEISTEVPIALNRYDGHIFIVNSKMLEELNITKDTLPQHEKLSGEIRIHGDGNPNGQFTEDATKIIRNRFPVPRMETLIEDALAFSKDIAAFGITTCGSVIKESEISIINTLSKQGVLLQDHIFFISHVKPKNFAKLEQKMQFLTLPQSQFAFNGLKIYLDGTFGAFTAVMFEPFSDSDSNEKGVLGIPINTMKSLVQSAINLGYDVMVHAIGDKANAIVVDAYQAAIEKKINEKLLFKDGKRECILRIEHGSVLPPELIPRLIQNRIMIASQPEFIRSEQGWLVHRIGPERMKYTYPYKSFFKHGIVLAGSSDHPIESPTILRAIQNTVIRPGFNPDERLSVYEAVQMYTLNAAIISGQSSWKGTLTPTKVADFVVLDQNIFEVPDDEIENIRVLATYRRGKRIFPEKL